MGLQKFAKIVHRIPLTFTLLPQKVTSYPTVLQYQNQEIDITAILLARLQSSSSFTSLNTHSFVYVYSSI